MPRARTLGELRASGYVSRSIKDEIRSNLRRKLASKESLFPGVLGYERTVIPGVVNALLAKHDFILLGLRGQAKTRLLRSLTDLLDEVVPILAGTELNDDPLAPVSTQGKRLVEEEGDAAPIEWWHRDERYHEKLATPDVSIADLLGDIDPIKAATQRLAFADPEVMHFGIVPRTNRGIFAINELPDLAPRIQVGLLNLLEENDLQLRGFPIRIPLDILMVFSANPEDYTNRGSIITPLKDRISSQILTHYPSDVATAAEITAQEAWTERNGDLAPLPEKLTRLVEEIAFVARDSDMVDQTSGVSARMPISALELLVSNLERRSLMCGAEAAAPRLCDLFMLLPAITGKVEMVYEGEQKGVEVVAKQIIGDAIKKLFDERFPRVPRAAGSGGEEDDSVYSPIIRWFAGGNDVQISDEQSQSEYQAQLDKVPGLFDLVRQHSNGDGPEEDAFAAELVLEGLHQSLKLGRDDLDSQITYKEMVKFQLLKPRHRSE